jgi:hypothetical protein
VLSSFRARSGYCRPTLPVSNQDRRAHGKVTGWQGAPLTPSWHRCLSLLGLARFPARDPTGLAFPYRVSAPQRGARSRCGPVVAAEWGARGASVAPGRTEPRLSSALPTLRPAEPTPSRTQKGCAGLWHSLPRRHGGRRASELVSPPRQRSPAPARQTPPGPASPAPATPRAAPPCNTLGVVVRSAPNSTLGIVVRAAQTRLSSYRLSPCPFFPGFQT